MNNAILTDQKFVDTCSLHATFPKQTAKEGLILEKDVTKADNHKCILLL